MNITELLSQSIGAFSLGNILSAIVTLIICLLIVRVVMRMVNRLLNHTKVEERIRVYITSGIRALLYVLTTVVVIQSLGVNTSSFVALLSVVSLGVTMAAEDVLGNVAGGLVILAAHPFKPGDIIESSGNFGTVEDIDLNHTKILTPDGQYVMIPNKDLAAARVINYSTLGRRRVKVVVSASYGSPTDAVFAACRDALSRTENILPEPEPAIWMTGYDANAIEYTIFCWALPGNYWSVLCTLTKNLRPAFVEHRVEMSYNHLNIHVVEDLTKKQPTKIP